MTRPEQIYLQKHLQSLKNAAFNVIADCESINLSQLNSLDEVIKMTLMLEENETERWEDIGRPKNDGYINGSHSGYCHAMRDLRNMIDIVKKANTTQERP